MPHHVTALALPGVVAFDLATVAQVFGHADEDEYTFTVASPTGAPVTTSTGFDIAGVHPLPDLRRADTIVVPGYRPYDQPHPDVLEALRDAHARGARVASVCTGAFALAAAGLLDGLSATTHWQDAPVLAQRHPSVQVDPDVIYLDHGHIATSAGVAAGIDLCLHLVRCDHGAHVANRIARRMVVAPHRGGGQAQFISPPPGVTPTLGELTAWAVAHLHEALGVPELAHRAGLSQRQLSRRFVAETGRSPLQWLVHQRVLAAMELLETTDTPLETIARNTGLGTASTLRRHFHNQLGITPTAYRNTFQGD